MIRLKDNFQKGRALSQISADWLNTVARWLNGMEMQNGVVDRYPDRMKLTLFGITGGGGGESRVISFGCTYSGLDITVKLGKVYFKGVIQSYTLTNPITIAATSYGYFSINLTNGVPTWTVSTSDPGNGDDDTEIWMVFVATVAGGIITELLECQHGDIHCMGNA